MIGHQSARIPLADLNAAEFEQTEDPAVQGALNGDALICGLRFMTEGFFLCALFGGAVVAALRWFA